MDERYTNSLIDSSKKYLNNLYYLGIKESVRDLNKYKILHYIHKWAVWMEADPKKIRKLEEMMGCVIRGNSTIVLPVVPTRATYSNVNTPQTDYTWQWIYDGPINSGPIIPMGIYIGTENRYYISTENDRQILLVPETI